VPARLVVVAGTGTGIGKTHVSEALLRTLQRSFPRVVGLKPVETGAGVGEPLDRDRLDAASSFHVKQSGYLFMPAVSPHLAARECGRHIELDVIRSIVANARDESDLTLVELAGGLFTPLSPMLFNVDVVRSLGANFALLVAPDRLGVLHDVLAATRAAAAVGVMFNAVALVAPEIADTSTHRNVLELRTFIATVRFHELPRAPVEDLLSNSALGALVTEILGA
jgi:dethiobiotin synthetase